MIGRIEAQKRLLHTDHCDGLIVDALLTIPKSAVTKRLRPQNLHGKVLESGTLLGHLDHSLSVVPLLGKMFVVILTASCFRAKAISLWNSERNIRPEISSLSVDRMPEG